MKKVLLFIILATGTTGAMLPSCKKNSVDQLVGSSVSCDTSNVSYSNDVVPILQEYCYQCHSSSSNGPGGGIILEGYGNIAGYAANNQLSGDISFAPGYTGMPYGRAQLPDCQLHKILAWVRQGIKQN